MKKILGKNPRTSLIGYTLAGLYAAQDCYSHGLTHWTQLIIPVGIAVLGRAAGDSANTN